MCLQNIVLHLDHVEVAVMGENSIHFAVQLLEGILNGVGGQCVISLNPV